MSTTSSAAKTQAVTPSTKPWFLTFSSDNKDVLVWKNGMRLKLRDGSSSGRVASVSIISEKDKMLTLHGFSKDGSYHFRFHCTLSAFVQESNDFTKGLAPYVNDPRQFCSNLNRLSDGAIHCDSSQRSSQEHPESSSSQECSNPRKRAKSCEVETEKTKKKKKKSAEHEEGKCSGNRMQLQQEISEHQIGVFTLPIDALRDPPPYLRVREVKEWYVDYLAEMLLDEKGDHEDLTAPLLVIASATKSDFRPKSANSYTYEVIGGVQRFTAISRINTKAGSRKITTRKCAVYGSGLSQSAKLMLARQHNEFNQIQRTTSFPEIAGCCRRLLFSHFAGDDVDDGAYMPDVPRYNTQAYRTFKQECIAFLVSSQVSLPMVEQAIQMALLPSATYHKMQKVFQLYEEGKIKGQKSRQMSGVTLQKALEGKLAAKLSHFKIFQGLQDKEKEELLEGLLNGERSFSEVEKASESLKALSTTKEAFLKEIKLASWAEAEAEVPQYANEEELKKFRVQKGKAFPKAFLMFCEKARAGRSRELNLHPEEVRLVVDGNTTFTAMDPAKLMHTDLGETDMVFMDTQHVFSTEEMDGAIHGITLSMQGSTSWTLVIHGTTNGIDIHDVEASCNNYGARCSRGITVCSTVRTEGDVDLGSCKEVVVVWWGSSLPPRGHILAEEQHMNTIVCHPHEEDTMLSEEPTGWIGYLVRHGVRKVADVYGKSGEVTQVCRALGLKCLCIQASVEAAKALMKDLGVQERETEGLDDDGIEEQSEEQSTEDLLQELSEAEKLRLEEGNSKSTKTLGAGASLRRTRSKGGSLTWSKSLNPDRPIS